MRRGAVVLPAGMYGPYTPLLTYAANAAEARGARIRAVSWSRPEVPPTLDPADRGPWVVAEAAPVLAEVAAAWPDVTPLVIARSFGAYAAPLAADRGLPAVWLTPDLTAGRMVDALRRATAPFLLVGGTGDEMWDPALARTLSPHVCEVEGADHGMYLPGRLAASASALGRVATAVEDFLDTVVWP